MTPLKTLIEERQRGRGENVEEEDSGTTFFFSFFLSFFIIIIQNQTLFVGDWLRSLIDYFFFYFFLINFK